MQCVCTTPQPHLIHETRGVQRPLCLCGEKVREVVAEAEAPARRHSVDSARPRPTLGPRFMGARLRNYAIGALATDPPVIAEMPRK